MKKALAILIILGAVGCPDSRPPAESPPAKPPAASPSLERKTVPDAQPVVGGLYASKGEDGSFSVVKVLAADRFAVHLRSYANRFDALPTDLDASTLTLGSIDDEHFGMGHFPLAREAFERESYTFLKKTQLEEEELEGYNLYLEAMGGR